MGELSYIKEITHKIDNSIQNIMKLSADILSLSLANPQAAAERMNLLFTEMDLLLNHLSGLVGTYGTDEHKKKMEEIYNRWNGLLMLLAALAGAGMQGQQMTVNGKSVPTVLADLKSLLSEITQLKWQVLYKAGFLPREKGYSLAERIGESLSILVVDDILEELEKHFGDQNA